MSVNELVQTYSETHTYHISHKTLVLPRKIEFEFLFPFRSLINQNNPKIVQMFVLSHQRIQNGNPDSPNPVEQKISI